MAIFDSNYRVMYYHAREYGYICKFENDFRKIPGGICCSNKKAFRSEKAKTSPKTPQQNDGCPPVFGTRYFQILGSATFVSLCCPKMMQNKTSIQWTPGSKIYLSSKKTILIKNDFWTKE